MKTTVVYPLLMVMLVLIGIQNKTFAQQFEEGRKTVLSSLPAMKGSSIAKDSNRTVQDSISGGNKTIKNIIVFKIKEDSTLFFKTAFTATVKFYLDTWTTISASPNTSSLYTLTVNYDPATGAKYNVRNYMVLDNSYEKVKVRVDGLTITGNTGWNPQPLLELDNQMQVLRYFDLSTSASAQTASFGTQTFLTDALNVNWYWSDPTLHNNMSQLEWAWLEDEMEDLYKVNGVLNTDLLFKSNSTRVDLDDNKSSYKIPLLYDGIGKLYYRVRPVLRKNNGTLVTGKWTAATAYPFNGHEPSLNWQSSTSFAEGGKFKTVIQYFDGSLRNRQTVTKDNETGNTIVGETIYDLQGRSNVQILPTPTIDNTIKFFDDFNRFVGQTSKTDDPARFFDLTPAAIKCNSAPKLDTAYGNGRYYSGNNDWLASEAKSKFIPNAKGYAYTETRFMDDATQRVSKQSGVGDSHIIGSDHETKYFYGKPAQQELDALFGTEVGDASHYSKNMVQDANGQLSVSYVDMHGRTIATALAGGSPNNLVSIANTLYYPEIPTNNKLTTALLTPATNIIKGNSIEAVNTILVANPNTDYAFTYQLNPAILSQLNCNNQQICFDCKYDLEISIRQEDCANTEPIIRKYSNLQIVPANQACGTSMGFIGENITTPTTTINFSQTLGIGSWVVRKTLTVNDSMFRVRKDSALKVFLCKTQDSIFQAVKSKLYQSSGCNESATSTSVCDSCNANLGNYAQYKAKYLASIGRESLDEATLRRQFLEDSITCANACSMSSNLSTLNTIRTQMLADMVPFTGQYAIDAIRDVNTGVVTTIPTNSAQARFNIFMGIAGTPATLFYKRPVTETGTTLSLYQTEEKQPDNSLLDPTTGVSILPDLEKSQFTSLFQRSWAGNLIYYHPEFSKLRFAETTLATSYAWLDKVQATATYAQALSLGYLTPLTSDPYFTNNYYSADNTTMAGYLNGSTSPSIWQIANSSVICATVAESDKGTCMSGTSPTGLDSRITATADKDKVWDMFRSVYLSYRNNMVLKHINRQLGVLSTAGADSLKNEGKQLLFASAQDVADQSGSANGGNNGMGSIWAAAAAGNASGAASAAASYTSAQGLSQDKCEAQRPYWKAKLLQCDTLLKKIQSSNPTDTLWAATIINTILDSMVMVCHNAQTSWQPYGASTVAPGYTGTPQSFEAIVRHVFANNGIKDTLGASGYYCNPFTIDAPGPYGTNLPIAANLANSIDSCGCARFTTLKTEAQALGYTTYSYTSMNQFFKTNYNDTLTITVWNALQNCTTSDAQNSTMHSGYNSSSMPAYTTTILPNPEVLPMFLNCGYQKPCFSCATLGALTAEFRQLYPSFGNVPYTNTGDNDTLTQRNALWARFINYRKGFSLNALTYITAYNNCELGGTNYTIGSGNDCGSNTAVDTLLVNQRLSPYPSLYVAKKAVIVQNGFTSNDGDNFTISADSTLASCSLVTGIAGNTNTIGGGSGSSTAIAVCTSTKPLNDISNLYVKDTMPCRGVETQAQFIAQMLYTKMQDSLIANFDSLYMTKCLSAQSVEVFTATYQPKEYHYTLYYYDQAGNLVKTLPPAAVQPNYNSTYLNNVASSRNMGIAYPNTANNEAMATNYRYNSLNQVVAQKTPDAGISNFWYDRLGRLALSQNAKQAQVHNYSYTMYDVLGRISQVGQVEGATEMANFGFRNANNQTYYIAVPLDNNGNPTADLRDIVCRNDDLWNQWINAPSANPKKQITLTVYDVPYTSIAVNAPGSLYQQNLRNRVSYSMVFNAATQMQTLVDGTIGGGNSATYYTYDIHGNVDTLVQDYNTGMGTIAGNRFKKMVYSYDLISGKVNYMAYQPNAADAFYHRYGYDAENKLTKVETSKDAVYWETDATYDYYRHGTLARTVLGQNQVQGLDYAYTIQGWLKGVNSTAVGDGSFDMGKDGFIPLSGGGGASLIARDAFGYSLNYFTNDYQPINTTVAPFAEISIADNLYNGNIKSVVVNTPKLGNPITYGFRYDQLNRLLQMDAYNALNNTTNIFATPATPVNDYKEQLTYDPNGNIKTYLRNGTGTTTSLNNYAYSYTTNTNQLASITNNAVANAQTKTYAYDAIGNTTTDGMQGVTNAVWNVYGKLQSLTNKNGENVTYTYDASGQRISKQVGSKFEYYVRDASGNLIASYVQDAAINSGHLTAQEFYKYGNSMLGTQKFWLDMTLTPSDIKVVIRGLTEYILADHRGNNMVAISDKKLQYSNNSTTIDYYYADVTTANYYSAYGAISNSYNADSIKFAFNGQELSSEISATAQTALYWEYNGDVGRRWNLDPFPKVWESGYVSFSDNPIYYTDWNGDVVADPYHIKTQNGDTYSKIAKKYKVSVDDLRKWNGYKDDEIPTGVQLIIRLKGSGNVGAKPPASVGGNGYSKNKQDLVNAIADAAETATSVFEKTKELTNTIPGAIPAINSALSIPASIANKTVPSSKSEMTWGDLFNIWLFELDKGVVNNSDITFGDNDKTTKSLKGQEGVNQARQIALARAEIGNTVPVQMTWTFGVNAAEDAVKNKNIVTAFLGSYSITVVSKVDITTQAVSLSFTVSNVSGWASATRFRRDIDGNGTHDPIVPDKQRGQGIKLGGNLRQKWNWNENH